MSAASQYLSNLTANSAHTQARQQRPPPARTNQTCSSSRVRAGGQRASNGVTLPYLGVCANAFTLKRTVPLPLLFVPQSSKLGLPPHPLYPPRTNHPFLRRTDSQPPADDSSFSCQTGEGYLTAGAGGWCNTISSRPGGSVGQTGRREVGHEGDQNVFRCLPVLSASHSTQVERSSAQVSAVNWSLVKIPACSRRAERADGAGFYLLGLLASSVRLFFTGDP